MKFKILLYPSDESFAVSAPNLPGCWSQGATVEEALKNIESAIQEYLADDDKPLNNIEIHELEIPVKVIDVNLMDAVRAFELAGYWLLWNGNFFSMTNGIIKITIPKNDPINLITMGGIIRDAGMTVEQFRQWL